MCMKRVRVTICFLPPLRLVPNRRERGGRSLFRLHRPRASLGSMCTIVGTFAVVAPLRQPRKKLQPFARDPVASKHPAWAAHGGDGIGGLSALSYLNHAAGRLGRLTTFIIVQTKKKCHRRQLSFICCDAFCGVNNCYPFWKSNNNMEAGRLAIIKEIDRPAPASRSNSCFLCVCASHCCLPVSCNSAPPTPLPLRKSAIVITF